jgi:hypothetical protein
LTTSPRIGLTWLISGLENPKRGNSHSPHKFWSSYEYLIHYQIEHSCTHVLWGEVVFLEGKVDGLIFPTRPLLLRIWNTQLVRGDWNIQIKVVATILMIFGAHMNILFIIKAKSLVLIKWSHRSPPIKMTIRPRMVFIFWALSPVLLKHVPFWYPFLEPHTTQNIGMQISQVHLKFLVVRTSLSRQVVTTRWENHLSNL